MSGVEEPDYLGDENIRCPYCGQERMSEDGELYRGTNVTECPDCGRSFTFEVDYVPTITSYRYKGRTDRHHVYEQWPTWCSVCGTVLESDADYPECPICRGVVCRKCERLMKPCCDEYARWAEETKEAA